MPVHAALPIAHVRTCVCVPLRLGVPAVAEQGSELCAKILGKKRKRKTALSALKSVRQHRHRLAMCSHPAGHALGVQGSEGQGRLLCPSCEAKLGKWWRAELGGALVCVCGALVCVEHSCEAKLGKWWRAELGGALVCVYVPSQFVCVCVWSQFVCVCVCVCVCDAGRGCFLCGLALKEVAE